MLLLICLFFVVALAGVGLALREMRGSEVPLPVGLLHGVAASVAIALLVVHDLHAPINRLVNSATAVFVLAALGGSVLLGLRFRRKPIDGLVVVLHGGFAVAALLLLVLGYVDG